MNWTSSIFRLVIAVFALIGFAGCEPHASSRRLKMLNVSALTLTEESQIRLIICEYLLQEVIKPSSNTVLFISAKKDEYAVMKSKFPNLRVTLAEQAEITADRKMLDTISREPGVILEVKWVNINDQKAVAHGGYFAGAGVTFDFDMRKDKDWRIEKVSGPTIAD